jgi:ABC-2 type transport system ATP-binding protein
MVQIENLSFAYNKVPVLKDISLSIAKGAVLGLAGLNGAGKTTLLEIIAGYLKPITGSANVDQIKCSYLETQPFFYSNITGKEYLSFITGKDHSFSIEKWNDVFHLPLHELIENYSSGMKKKLAIMGIIALERELILLDEPFNALDLESVEIVKLILPILKKQGKTIIITSHILSTLTDTCDSICYLENGSIKGIYSKQQFPGLAEELLSDTSNRFQTKIDDAFSNS